MSLKEKFLALFSVITLIVVMLGFAIPVSAATDTLLDEVNIGDTISESDHNIQDWSDCFSGCGWCGPDGNMRLLWGKGDGVVSDDLNGPDTDNWASVDLNTNGGIQKTLRVEHLCGAANDFFDVYINDEFVYSFTEDEPANIWYETYIDISGLVLDGSFTVKFVCPAEPWPGINNYGQVAFNLIQVLGNYAPVVGPISAPAEPVSKGIQVNATANFTDQDAADTHTATWDWGDGPATVGTVTESSSPGTVTGSHTYAAAGVYTVTLTVSDGTDMGTSTCQQYVVVYDSTAGFVTGGGWIMSPVGAYSVDQSLEGKANFGFVSKYKKGATVPTGNTEFQFKAGNLNFKSTSYDWLVIAGARAQFKGSGMINGTGDYGFMLTAIDGQINGGGGVDKFRIKIWDKSSNTMVYDNLIGEEDDAEPTTTLGGGSIVIHK